MSAGAAPIIISFAVEGQQAVKGVFDSLEQRMVRFDQETTKSQQRGSQERTTGTKREVDQREREYARLVKETEKWERASVKEAEKASKDKEKAVEVEEKRKLAIRENSQRMAHQLLEQEVRNEERNQARITQVYEREQKKRAAMAAQQAAVAARQAAQVQRGYSHAIGHAGMSSLSSTLSGATSLVGTALSIGGGFAVADATRKEMSFSRSVAQASNMSYIPGATTREQVAPSVIEGMSKGAQALTNLDKEDVANGIKRYVGLSSDFEGLHGKSGGKMNGRDLTGLDELAILSKASGTSFETMMTAAASVKANNKGMNTEGLISTMRSMLGAGKQGTLPLDQMASEVGEIQASASRFGGTNTTEGMTKAQQQLLGLVQIAGRATGGDAARAATAVKDFTGDIARQGHKVGLGGKDVYVGGDSKAGMLAPHDLLANYYAKTHGDFSQEQKVFGQRSMPLADALNPIFSAAEKDKKGSGVEAVRSAVKGFETQSYSPEDTMKEFASVMATDGERIDKAFKHIEETIEGHVAPMLDKFASTLEEHQGQIDSFLDSLAEVAGFMLSHPWVGLFGVLTASLGKDLAEAAIGLTIKNAMTTATTAGMSAAIPGMAGLIGAAAAAAIAYGISQIDKKAKEDADEEKKHALDNANSGSLIERLKQGRATPEEVEKAKGLQRTLNSDVQTLNGPSWRKAFAYGSGLLGGALGMAVGGPMLAAFGSVAVDAEVGHPQRQQMDKETSNLLASLNELTAAIKHATGLGPTVATGPQPGGPSGLPGLGAGGMPTNAPPRNVPSSHPSRGGLG